MPDGGNKGSFVQGYDAQIAVDSESQVIVAAEVTQETNDKKQLLPMMAQIVTTDQKPEKISADTGYFSEANVTDESVKGVDLYVATEGDKHGSSEAARCEPPPRGASPEQTMRSKLRTESGRAVYKMRKAIVMESVFGQIKELRGFRRFSLRGKQNVRREWRLVCAVSNLLKLFQSGWALETA